MKTISTRVFFLFIIFIIQGKVSIAQLKHDTTVTQRVLPPADSVHIQSKISSLDSFLKKNIYLNNSKPTSFGIKERSREGEEFLFYLLAVTVFLLALCKVFYSKYFNNIFRVFFNTSLRQNQLTDLLLQSKLPSLIFNIFFVISLGLYIWLLINHYTSAPKNNYVFAALSILTVAAIYTGKFIALKFIGWASGMSYAAQQYIFVIFLINKIIGILLIPILILIAFAPSGCTELVILSSYFMLGILFILRYLRSYGLLQNQLLLNPFHFLLYIFAVEFLPAVIIYKLFIKVLFTL